MSPRSCRVRKACRSGGCSTHWPPALTASEPEAHDRGESNQHPAFLERQDCTPMACYPSLYAPRTGGAYDSHHRAAGIAGRTRRHGGCVAARGARAADAGDRGPPIPLARGIYGVAARIPPGPQGRRNVHWRDFYQRNGTVMSTSMGRKRTGKWLVENDQLCIEFEKEPIPACYDVWLSGKQVELRREGLLPLQGTLEPSSGRN